MDYYHKLIESIFNAYVEGQLPSASCSLPWVLLVLILLSLKMRKPIAVRAFKKFMGPEDIDKED